MPNAYDKLAAKLWAFNKNIDPLTPQLFEGVMKQDAHNVAAIDKFISKAFGGDGSTVIGDESRKVENDPVRGLGRAALVAGGVFAAPYVFGSAGGGAGAGGAGAYAPATNSVLADSAMSSAGYGASSAGPGLGAYAGGGAGSAMSQYPQPSMGGQSYQQQPVAASQVGDPFGQQKKEALILAMMEAERRKDAQSQFSGGGYYG